jgi:hypothetical protein
MLVDNVSELSRRDWGNVVAIFVHGQEWQFKAFPAEWGGVAGIFNRVKGMPFFLFFFHVSESSIDSYG